jgi:Cys-tRNA(Pro)/Cys-tRNA(Cys) deacylase
MRRPLRLVVDASVETQATVYVSAGRRGLQIEITPRDLVRLGTANMADIAG